MYRIYYLDNGFYAVCQQNGSSAEEAKKLFNNMLPGTKIVFAIEEK